MPEWIGGEGQKELNEFETHTSVLTHMELLYAAFHRNASHPSSSHLLWAAASLNIPTAASWILACRRKKGTIYPCPGTAKLVK